MRPAIVTIAEAGEDYLQARANVGGLAARVGDREYGDIIRLVGEAGNDAFTSKIRCHGRSAACEARAAAAVMPGPNASEKLADHASARGAVTVAPCLIGRRSPAAMRVGWFKITGKPLYDAVAKRLAPGPAAQDIYLPEHLCSI